MKFQDDEIDYFESEAKDPSEQAHKMLQIWMENEDEPTADLLKEPLIELQLEDAWNEVFASGN